MSKFTSPRRELFALPLGLILFVFSSLPARAQQSLAILPGDISIRRGAGGEGYDLYIRKLPGVGSVLLTESTEDPTGAETVFSYRALEWNDINGNETRVRPSNPPTGPEEGWILMDSTPESHPVLGQAFHIYIPPMIAYGAPNTRNGIITVQDGLFVNIRAFSQPYIDYNGPFMDNPFVLSASDPTDDDPDNPFPLESALIPASEAPLLPSPAQEAERSFLPEKTRPGLNITLLGGAVVFFSGPEGTAAEIPNRIFPVGTGALDYRFTEVLSYRLIFDRDPILGNRITVRAALDSEFIDIEAGPYFGFLNTETGYINAGLSIGIHARFPNTVLRNFFFSSRYDASPGKDISVLGEYVQSFGEISAGYALPFGRLILSVSGRSSSFMVKNNNGGVTDRDDNNWTRYNLALEIPRPEAALGFRINAGYQKLQWWREGGAYNYKYNPVYLGFEMQGRINPSVSMIFGLEAPVYPFEYHLIQSIDSPQAPLFCQGVLGFRIAVPSGGP
ncbi:MAG: hypothetical protein LBU18_05210 [Treponema sp.]|jgi:hypothetical protein|nr:hypothetical protein [Treponema sp.]